MANSSVCLSQQCIQASATILSHISSNYQNIDPCSNFDELVCGGFLERTAIPDWEISWEQGNVMHDINYNIMRNILEPSPDFNQSGSWTDGDNFQKLLTGYDACMNQTAITQRDVKPLISFLDAITGMFPITMDGYRNPKTLSSSDYRAFSKTYLYLAKHSIFPFLSIDVNLDPYHPDTYIPTILPTGVDVWSQLTNEPAQALYQSTMRAVFTNILPTNALKFAAEQLAGGVVDLEKKIVAEMPKLSVLNLTSFATLDNTTQLAPMFDFPSVFDSISSSPVDKLSYIARDYSLYLSGILANTTKPVIQAFFMWQAIQYFKDAVEGPALKPLRQFDNRLNSKHPDYLEARWKTCMKDAEDKMPWLLSKPFVEVAYTAAVKHALEELTTRIQARLASNIAQIPWMTEKVKAIARHKVESIIPKLGYPHQGPNIDDEASLAAYYADLPVTSSHFDNALAYSRWHAAQTAALFHAAANRTQQAWPRDAATPLVVNAQYYRQENSILVMAAILQPPVLGPELPAYVNYGGLGTIVGHELTHALDANGRRWDADGALVDWWDDASDAGFAQKAQCLVKQYGGDALTVAGVRKPVDGTLSLSENIADAGGVNTAFDAWQDRRREDPNADFDLPGLRNIFSHEQLFFVSASQFFCQKLSDEGKAGALLNDHAPSRFRIKNMMENSRGFREAFKCPVREPTCEIY
ncbi:Metalloprotease [Hypoxylon sp. NC1633]|nr:Metalloprotease [Hypoxylon sp. NC1633]